MMRGYWSGFLIVVCALLGLGAAYGQTASSTYTMHYRYDDARRVVGSIHSDPDGGGYLKYPATRTTYDSRGRVIREESGELASWQAPSIAPSAWAGFTVYKTVETEYDDWGRPVKSYVLDGTTRLTQAETSYDGFGRTECSVQRMNPAVFNTISVGACDVGTEGAFGPDRVTKTVYDDFGRVTHVKKAVGTSLEQDYQTYTYNDSHTVDTVSDANGNTTHYTYDVYNRLEFTYFPSKTTPGQYSTTDFERYFYDANSNMRRFKNRAGQNIYYDHDNLNRVWRKRYSAAGERDVYYSYDLRGLELKALFDSASGDGIHNTYDGFGRLYQSSSDLTGDKTLTYKYDPAGNRTRLTHPDGVYFGYWHNQQNKLTMVMEEDIIMIRQFFKRSGILLKQVHEGHFDRRIQSADKALRPTQMTLFALGDASGASNLTEDFSYNPSSQLADYTVDNTDYLYSDGASANLAGSYQVNGLNQYTSVDGASYTYDAKGNLTSDGVNSYGYDSENRMVSAPGATLKYDPYGRLYEIVTSQGTSRFVYDGDAMVMELDGSNALVSRFVHGPGVDQPLVWYAGSEVGPDERRHLLADRQGSIVAVSTSDSAAPTRNTYDAFGIPGAANMGRFSYTGQVYLHEIGLMYYKARIYNPPLGRFMQTDPIGYDDQMNLYAYVGNDPMNAVDPSGMETIFDLIRGWLYEGDCYTCEWVGPEYSAYKSAAFEAASNPVQDTRGLPNLGYTGAGPGGDWAVATYAAGLPVSMEGQAKGIVYNIAAAGPEALLGRVVGAVGRGAKARPIVGTSKKGLKHMQRHLPEFRALDPTIDLEQLVKLGKQIVATGDEVTGRGVGRAWQKQVKIGEGNVAVRAVINEADNLRTVHIRQSNK